jgi:hypothetical protein
MPSRGETIPRGRAGRHGAAIDDQANYDNANYENANYENANYENTDRLDQIEAAVRWIQTRELLFKRIAALQTRNGLLRATKNRTRKAPPAGSAPALTASKRNR